MVPQLVASAASGLGGTSGDITWNMTIPNLGRNGLIVLAWLGKEEGGETNPEEINVAYYNGQGADAYVQSNINETGGGLAYIYTASKIPSAGTYTAGLNFKDSPKQAEKKRGVSVAFTNVKRQAAEATNTGTGSGSPRSVGITPLTNNALVIASFSWRTGFAVTWGGGFTEIVTSRGDNSAGVSLAYVIQASPAALSPSATVTNPEDNGMAVASFAMQAVHAGQIL